MLEGPFENAIKQLCEDVLFQSEPSELPDKIIDHIAKTFPVEWSTIWVTKQKGSRGDKQLVLKAASGKAKKLMTAENDGPAEYSFGEGLTGDIALKNRTVNISKPSDFDHHQHNRKYDRIMYGRESAGDLCRCVLGVPLRLRSHEPGEHSENEDPWRVIGVLKLENVKDTAAHMGQVFTERDVEIVESYAAVIAIALEKAQLRADSIRIGASLLDVSRSLLEELGKRPKLKNIVQQTAEAISAEACALWLRSGLQLRLEAAYGYPGSILDVDPYHLEDGEDLEASIATCCSEEEAQRIRYKGRGLTVFVANSSKPLNLRTAEEVRNHFAWKGANDSTMWEKENGQACYSLVAIPLNDDETGDLKGVFKIENKKPTLFQLENYFTREDQQLLSTLGNAISLSLITAERVERMRCLEKLVGDFRILENKHEAMFSILTGLTHGGGLQYNRAMIFLLSRRKNAVSASAEEDDPGELVCEFAIGQIEPRDWQLAMESAEPEELQNLDLDGLIQQYREDRERFKRGAMMQRWRNRCISLDDSEEQILARHVRERSRGTGTYVHGDLGENDVLRDFGRGDFVLIPIYIDKKLEGMIYADNEFTGNRINKFECEVLDLFAGMAGAILQASEVPEKLRNERDDAWRNFSRPAAHRLGTEAGIIDNETTLYIKKEMLRAVRTSSGTLPFDARVIEKSIRVIGQAVKRLRDAVKDYQRLTAEPESPEFIDFCGLVQHTKQTTIDDARNVSVEVIPSQQQIWVYAERKGLSYVLEELLINAWKEVIKLEDDENASRLREIRVRIRIGTVDEKVRCIVSDNGNGIDQKARKDLFEKPYRGRSGGTGLGLYISRQILLENGGNISLSSGGSDQDLKGACFLIELPVASTNRPLSQLAPVENGSCDPSVTGLLDASVLRGRRVLVVEDNPDLGRHLADFFVLCGMTVELKKNEHEAILMEAIPDIVIADIDLSEASGSKRGGIEFAESLVELNLRVPVILISYDLKRHLPTKGSQEFQALNNRFWLAGVLDRNSPNFNDLLKGRMCEIFKQWRTR